MPVPFGSQNPCSTLTRNAQFSHPVFRARSFRIWCRFPWPFHADQRALATELKHPVSEAIPSEHQETAFESQKEAWAVRPQARNFAYRRRKGQLCCLRAQIGGQVVSFDGGALENLRRLTRAMLQCDGDERRKSDSEVYRPSFRFPNFRTEAAGTRQPHACGHLSAETVGQFRS